MKEKQRFNDLRAGLESLCADRVRSRREWADNIMGGGEQGDRWFERASPTVTVEELRLLLDHGVVESAEPAEVVMGKARDRMRREEAETRSNAARKAVDTRRRNQQADAAKESSPPCASTEMERL
jgi:hypothetical protein